MNHWSEDRMSKLHTLETFKEMADMALDMLSSMPGPISQICGPLTTGGRGSLEENMKMFQKAIEELTSQGKVVFDQRPFEIPMQKLKKTIDGYAYEILEEFYLPIFKSGYVKELHFLPGWESSIGASWEHEQAENLGLARFYFPQDWLNIKL